MDALFEYLTITKVFTVFELSYSREWNVTPINSITKHRSNHLSIYFPNARRVRIDPAGLADTYKRTYVRKYVWWLTTHKIQQASQAPVAVLGTQAAPGRR